MYAQTEGLIIAIGLIVIGILIAILWVMLKKIWNYCTRPIDTGTYPADEEKWLEHIVRKCKCEKK